MDSFAPKTEDKDEDEEKDTARPAERRRKGRLIYEGSRVLEKANG